MNPINSTAGHIRKMLVDSMVDVKNGKMDKDTADTLANLAKETSNNINAEINLYKLMLKMREAGLAVPKLASFGNTNIIGDEPPLDGTKGTP